MAIIRRAASEAMTLSSVSFSLEHEVGTTALFPGLEMSKASGVVDIPGKFKLKVEAEITQPRSYVEINVITIEDKIYMTDLITGQWNLTPWTCQDLFTKEIFELRRCNEFRDLLPVNLNELGLTLGEIIKAVESPQLVNSTSFRGREAYRITGNVLSQGLAGLVPGAAEGFIVTLEMWLDREDGFLLQARIIGKVVPTDVSGTIRVLVLDQFNAPVNITPPE